MKTKLILGAGLITLSAIMYSQPNSNPWPTSGNVGIGTTSPAYPLDVQTTLGSARGIRIRNNGTVNNGGEASLRLDASPVATGGREYGIHSIGNGWGAGIPAGCFMIRDETVPQTPRLIILKTGKVGIGTVNPLAKFEVYETDPNGTAGLFDMTIPGSVSQNVGIRAFGGSSSGWNHGGIFGASGTGVNTGIWSIVSGNPGDLAGNFYGDVNIVGNAYCTLNLWSSDKKLKKDIQPLTSSLSKLALLKPSSYLFRTEEFKTSRLPDGIQLGLIAQELEEVFPELVSEITDKDMIDAKGNISGKIPGHKVVNYIGLIPVMIGGIQEQQAMIQQQDKDNAALKAQLIDQQKQLSEQKQLIEALSQKVSGTTGINNLNGVETGFQMSQNEPNPFTHETVVRYTLPQTVNNAFMAVYDLTGKQISTFPITEKGSSSLTMTSEKLAAGIYIYSIVADGKVIDSKRMIVAEK